MRRFATLAFLIGAPFALLAESPNKAPGCYGSACARSGVSAKVKSCATAAPDIAAKCEGVRLFAPETADLQGFDLLRDVLLYWPQLQQGMGFFRVDKGQPILPSEPTPERPRLLALYVRIRTTRLDPDGTTSKPELILTCQPADARTVLGASSDAITEDYYQVRAIDLSQANTYCKELPYRQDALAMEDTAPLADGVREDVFFEAYVSIHGEAIGWRKQINVPASLIARANGNAQATVSLPDASPAVKPAVKEVFVLDPRTATTPGPVSPERPLILVVSLNGPLDAKGPDIPQFLRLRAAGQDAALGTAAYGLSATGRFVLAVATEAHDDTELLIDPNVKVRGVALGADAVLPKATSEHVKLKLGALPP